MIKRLARKARSFLRAFLIIKDFRKFAVESDGRFSIAWRDFQPQLSDKTVRTEFDLHYIYHPAWAARVLAETKPAKHIDISSSLSFSTLVSAWLPVDFYDFRPADLRLSNLTSQSVDLNRLPFSDNSVASLSCMHTVEHIGLGRYGDKIDPRGDLKAMAELARVLAPGGNLLLVVPVGQPRICFNAHRIYSFEQIISSFPTLALREFTLISEKEKTMIRPADPKLVKAERYGCGCFWFIKK